MLGARIAALRRQAGMNQAQLAEILQISASAVGMYEQGRREPSAQMLLALARALGVSVDFLLTGEVTARLDEEAYTRMLRSLVGAADRRLESRGKRPFTRQELAVLFAALLTDSEIPL